MQRRECGGGIDAEVKPHPERDERRSVDESEERGQSVRPSSDDQGGDEKDVFGHMGDLDAFSDAQGARRVLRSQRHLPGGQCAEEDDVSGEVEGFDAHAWLRCCGEERAEPQEAVRGTRRPR